jgi:hypothetical protein
MVPEFLGEDPKQPLGERIAHRSSPSADDHSLQLCTDRGEIMTVCPVCLVTASC